MQRIYTTYIVFFLYFSTFEQYYETIINATLYMQLLLLSKMGLHAMHNCFVHC